MFPHKMILLSTNAPSLSVHVNDQKLKLLLFFKFKVLEDWKRKCNTQLDYRGRVRRQNLKIEPTNNRLTNDTLSHSNIEDYFESCGKGDTVNRVTEEVYEIERVWGLKEGGITDESGDAVLE